MTGGQGSLVDDLAVIEHWVIDRFDQRAFVGHAPWFRAIDRLSVDLQPIAHLHQPLLLEHRDRAVRTR